MPNLYCSISGVTQPLSVTISSNHNNATTLATVNCISTTLDIGDEISIDLGFTDDHAVVFTGYIRTVDRQVPDNVYTITAQDKLVQAIDYFIVSQDPEHPYNFGKGISAEALVEEVLNLADLSLFDHDNTNFEFGVNNDVEVNLVSSYDYAKMIADIVTWSIWCDRSGNIYFMNRKPFVMKADPGQISWHVDVPVNAGDPWGDERFIDFIYKRSEKELRNRVVVYGEGGIKADLKSGLSYDPLQDADIVVLPDGFYKSVVVSYQFIGTQAIADTTADYNLEKLNRLTIQANATLLGDPSIEARQVITISEAITGIPETNWYIFGCDHTWSSAGYTTSLDLRM